ncbi:6-phosphogluconolactonase [Flaviramulus basaltis]|uniref:6-phosphogluconolactonase n=1 Tax=Flaviramulus basaltis TaxID=369401 RepID=A0A1K2IBB0_9FLAO|nr:lactonase family protein [Flaviramulus basaltis]SFZ89562.1 6-phosphogluconolactonase [Flaviramulus basaltis]
MKLKILLLVTIVFFSCKQQTKSIPLYIGTYTSGDSEGIYKLLFNTETGELKDLSLAATIDNPSFITYSPNKKNIYAVGEGDDGTVSSFKVEEAGTLQLINKVKSHGGAPCHISTNKEGNKLATSNYVGGNMALYDIKEDGSLNEASQVFDHNSLEQKSHVHSAQFYKNNLFVADLGRNAMYLYKKESNNNYKLKDSSIVKFTKNAGPRHFALTNNGDFIYIINEYASTITTAKKVGDSYELINHTSTLSKDYSGENSCADIHLSKNERFIYGSNRGENSIAVFKRNTETGTIEKIQNVPVHGDWPRNFTLDPTGKFLLVANKKSSNISVFSVDASSGELSFLNDIALPNPVCLLF